MDGCGGLVEREECAVLVMQYGSKICFEIEIYEELNFKIMTFNLHFVLSWYSNNLLLESVSYCPSGHAMTTDNLLYCILSYVVSLKNYLHQLFIT